MEHRNNTDTFIYILLGALTAFAPFVTDMYLPALPTLTQAFSASVPEVQTGLTSSMLGLAAGQLVIGPLSDKFGRKIPLMVSLGAFIIATALCICASHIGFFVVMRFFQGIGAAGGIVLSRSIAADIYAGKGLARVMAVIGAINGIAPVVSPVIGGVMLAFTAWQGIFVVLLAIGIALAAASSVLNESYPRENRRALSVLQTFAQTGALFKNPKFRIYTFMQAACMGVFFAQISAAPFVFQNLYGFSQIGFSGFFAFNALTLGVCSFLSASRFKTPTGAIRAGSAALMAASCLTALALCAHAPVALFEVCLWGMHVGFGLLFPPITAQAMTHARHSAGMGSAIFGASGFVTGGIASPLVGIGDMAVSAGILYVAGAACTLLCARIACKAENSAASDAAESDIRAALSPDIVQDAGENI